MSRKQTRLRAGKRTLPITQTIDGATGKALPLYRCRLNDIRDVKRELARIYRRLMGASLDPAIAGRAAFILSSLARIIEGGDLEQRITDLEKQAHELEQRKSPQLVRNA